MGNIIQRVMKQRCVYFAPLAPNTHGEPQWGPPEEIACRWDDKRVQVIDDSGTAVFSRVELITEVLLEPGGIVCKGTLNTLSYWSDAKANPYSYEVLKSSSTPDFKARRLLYEAWA